MENHNARMQSAGYHVRDDSSLNGVHHTALSLMHCDAEVGGAAVIDQGKDTKNKERGRGEGRVY